MSAAGRFDEFHSGEVRKRLALPSPNETHVAWAGLTALVALAAVALTVTTYRALDVRVSSLLSNLNRVTVARDTNGFFTLSDPN